MNAFFDTISLAFVWVLAQNLLLTGGYGISPALHSPRPVKKLFRFAGVTTVLTLIASMLATPLSWLLSLFYAGKYLLPVSFVLVIGLVYLMVTLVLYRLRPPLLKKIQKLLTPAAFNTLIFSVLLLNENSSRDFFASIGFSVTAGISFLLVSLLVVGSERISKDPKIPVCFYGRPAAFIYLGLAAMAFYSMSGYRIY